MTLEEVLAVMEEQEAMHHTTVRLHTGDPSMYGAIREQMDALDEKGIGYDVTPGVSSVFGAAAALNAEFTLPGISQTLILTRMAGRTPVPEREAGGHRVQSDLARGEDRVLYGRDPRRDRGAGRHQSDRPHLCGRLPDGDPGTQQTL